jgi:hypothetical protein
MKPKPLTGNSAINVLAVIEALVLIPLIVFWAMGKMSTAIFILAVFVTVIFTLSAIFIIFYKYAPIVDKEAEELDKIEVKRNREGTTMEVATAIMLAITWVIMMATHQFTDADGGFDFSKLWHMLIFTIGCAMILIDVYTPSEIHLGGKLKNIRQVALAVRMNRVIAVGLALISLLRAIPALNNQLWLTNSLTILLIVAFIVFRILIYRAKK